MATATRAAVTGLAMSYAKLDGRDSAHHALNAGDVQLLAREFLALQQEKNSVQNGGNDDFNVRAMVLEFAVQAGGTSTDDVIAAAFLFRAFLEGNNDVGLLDRVAGVHHYMADEDKYTTLHGIVLGTSEPQKQAKPAPASPHLSSV